MDIECFKLGEVSGRQLKVGNVIDLPLDKMINIWRNSLAKGL